MASVGGVSWRLFRHDGAQLDEGQDFPFYSESATSGQAVYRYWALRWNLQPGTYFIVLAWWYDGTTYKRLAGYSYSA